LRILVLSDSHGKYHRLIAAIAAQPTAEVVLFLGDGLRDFERAVAAYDGLPKTFLAVQGNCDYTSEHKEREFLTLDGVKLYITHGHVESVKNGEDVLIRRARQYECQVALYGHTHVPVVMYQDGLHLLNPGSMHSSRDRNNPTYGIVDITSAGIVPYIVDFQEDA